VSHEDNGERSLRMGLIYGKGLRQEVGEAIVESRNRAGTVPLRGRSYTGVYPCCIEKNSRLLARIGRSELPGMAFGHRRDAVWQWKRPGAPGRSLC